MVEDSKADSGGAPGGKEKPKVCKIREFLVKWQGKSYWKCSWVSELRVSQSSNSRYLHIHVLTLIYAEFFVSLVSLRIVRVRVTKVMHACTCTCSGDIMHAL